MCGIAGAFHRFAGHVTAEAVERMAARLRHRGPDRRSVHVSPSGSCALGHSRLRIIDLETGDQPMSNEDGSVWVVFNGEIYNFPELRRELESHGHAFRTQSDTETIVHGYEVWGDDLANRLDGMFAFAVWDERRRRLVLGRDRAGKKPLFVYEDERKLVFASEVKAILEYPEVDDRIDPAAVPLYLAYGYVPTPGTFYRRIRKLPAASVLAVESSGETREWTYWHLEFRPRPISRDEAAERVRATVREAVRRRMVADVPIGAFLSGGVDSSIVVGLMSEAAAGRVKTFSIGFAGDATYDETSYARMAAERFGTDHTEFMLEPQSIDLVDRLVEAYDEPFGDSSAIPTFVISELTRRHVTVALTGDGGDEVFAGYLRFYGAVLGERVPKLLLRAAASIARRLPQNGDFRSVWRRAARFTHAATLPLDERMLRWIGFFAEDVARMLRPEVLALDRAELTKSFRAPLERAGAASPLSRVLALNFCTYLLDDLLPKADRCSMAHGLELRSPLLDTAVVELAATLPDRMKLRSGITKFILKHAFRDLLPREIRTRGKMGFGIPLPKWFRGEWRALVSDRLLSPDAKLYRWLRPEPIAEMARAHFDGKADYGHQLWALVTLETWLEQGRYSAGE